MTRAVCTTGFGGQGKPVNSRGQERIVYPSFAPSTHASLHAESEASDDDATATREIIDQSTI